MLRMEAVRTGSPLLPQVLSLYERAFPENERRPLEPLLADRSGCSDFVAFMDGDDFCGFACLLTWRDITHLIYFAIEDHLRGRGYGTEALKLMLTLHPGHRYIADLEAPDPAARNFRQRESRRAFYMHAGYTPTKVHYSWLGEKYEILALGGKVSTWEFRHFWLFLAHRHQEISDY